MHAPASPRWMCGRNGTGLRAGGSRGARALIGSVDLAARKHPDSRLAVARAALEQQDLEASRPKADAQRAGGERRWAPAREGRVAQHDDRSGGKGSAHASILEKNRGRSPLFSRVRAEVVMPEFIHQPILEHGHDETSYRRLEIPSQRVRIAQHGTRRVLEVDPEAPRELAAVALDDISHLLRASHLAQLARILDDPEASDNDRFVALELLTNANIAAGRELPGCQDTGTAIVVGY